MALADGAVALLDLLLPADCGGCGLPGVRWCPACAASAGPPRAVPLPGGPRVVAAGRYRGPLRAALLAYKERGRRDLAVPLAALLAAAVPAGAVLVPAPSRRAAARARGGDHVRRLCRAVRRRRPDVTVAPALRLAGPARDSVGLDAAQRAANLAGRIEVRRPLLPPRGLAVVLVDDVVTTGATLRACAAALTAAGVRAGAAAVLCDATRAGSPPVSGRWTKDEIYPDRRWRNPGAGELPPIGVTRRTALLPDCDPGYRPSHPP